MSAADNTTQPMRRAGPGLKVTIPVIEVPADTTEFEKKKVRHASGASVVSAAESLAHWIPTPPDGGYGWVIVLAAFFNHVIVDGIAYTFGVFYTAFLEHFEADPAKTSLVGSMLGGFYMFTAPIAGALVNKFGCRPVAIAGSIIAVIGFALSSLSTSIEMLIVTYGVIGGSGLGCLILPNIIAVSYYFEKRRAIATGIAVCGAGVGCFVFAPLSQYLLTVFVWPSAMLIIAGIALNGCVFCCLLKPLKPPGLPNRSRRTRSKNILDRLKEKTDHRRGRRRKSSEGSEYGSTYGGGASNQQELLRRIQMIKLAKESALKEEEDDAGTDVGGSVLNSVMTLGGEYDVSSPLGGRSHPIDIVGQRGSGSGGAGGSYGHTPEGGLIASVIASRGLQDLVERDESNLEEEGEEEGSQAGISPPTSLKSPIYRRRPDSIPVGTPTAVLDSSLTVGDDNDSRHVSILDSNTEVVCPSYNTLNVPPLDSVPEVTTGEAGLRQRRGDRERRGGDSNRLKLPDGVTREDYARPLYRQDIFYSGSIVQLSQYRSQPEVQNYTKSVIAIPADIGSVAGQDRESLIWRKLPLWKEAKDALKGMTDCSLFSEPLFLIPALSNLFGTIGLYVPFVFLKDRALAYDVSEQMAPFLLSIIGITNTIGRVIAGILASFSWCNSLMLHNIAIGMAGVACLLNSLAVTYPTMCAFAAGYGFCIAVWISLTSIVLCDLLGLERLTNAFGLLCLARGVAAAIGAPIAGLLIDPDGDGLDRNMNAPFILSGAMLLISSVLVFLLHAPYFQQRKNGALTAPVDLTSQPDDGLEWADIDLDLDNDCKDSSELVSNGGEKVSARMMDSLDRVTCGDKSPSIADHSRVMLGNGGSNGTVVGSPGSQVNASMA